MSTFGRAAALTLFAVACSASSLKPSAPPPTTAEQSAKILEAFSAWTVEDTSSADCAAYFASCVDTFQRRTEVGAKTAELANPRSFMANPDPRWIPGWDRLPSDPSQGSLAFAALTFAAATRAHWTDCEQRYVATDAARTKNATFVDAEIRRLRGETNAYRKLSGLVQLRTELLHDKRDAIGPRYTIEVAIHDAFVETGRDFIYAMQNQRAEDAGLLRPSFSFQDELDLTCSEWLPAWQDPTGLSADIVHTPVSQARLAQLRAKVEAARDLDQRIPKTSATIPPSLLSSSADPGALVAVEREANAVPLTIKKVEDKEGTLVVELTGAALKKSAPFNCKDSDKATRVDDDGKLHYETICERRDESWRISVRVLLHEPPDLELKAGDEMVVLGKLVTLERKEKRQDATTIVTTNVEVEGSHILEVWRQKLLVADYFVQ